MALGSPGSSRPTNQRVRSAFSCAALHWRARCISLPCQMPRASPKTDLRARVYLVPHVTFSTAVLGRWYLLPCAGAMYTHSHRCRRAGFPFHDCTTYTPPTHHPITHPRILQHRMRVPPQPMPRFSLSLSLSPSLALSLLYRRVSGSVPERRAARPTGLAAHPHTFFRRRGYPHELLHPSTDGQSFGLCRG